MFSHPYFQDPRFRRERIFWVLVLPLLIVLLPGLVFLLYLAHDREPREPVRNEPPVTRQEPVPIAKIAPEAPPSDPTAEWIAAAEKSCRADDATSAAELLQARTPTSGDSSRVRELTARLQTVAGDFEDAMETCRRGIRAAPSPGLHYQMALLLRQENKLESALEELNAALSLAPADTVLSNQRYLLLLQMGKDGQVRKEITEQVSAPVPTPANAWILGVAGLALQDGQFVEAAQLLRQARQITDGPTFQTFLESPVISRHQSQPEIFPLFIRNRDVLSPSPKERE